jgi:LPS O-antigen subunit length determinant protein (WzzB/FepE family)
MDQNNPNPDYMQNDEIDLAELARVLWSSKKLIVAITATVTLLAAIYVFNKTPMYEASAIVKIGYYNSNSNSNININSNSNSNSNQVKLETAKDLVKIIPATFKEPGIASISTIKGLDSFIKVSANAASNKQASSAIVKVVQYLKDSDNKKIKELKSNLTSKINILEQQIVRFPVEGLITKKFELVVLLEDYNYKVSEMVGEIATSKQPVKPKKALVISVAAIASLLFSIFLVFVINAFKKDNDKAS